MTTRATPPNSPGDDDLVFAAQDLGREQPDDASVDVGFVVTPAAPTRSDDGFAVTSSAPASPAFSVISGGLPAATVAPDAVPWTVRGSRPAQPAEQVGGVVTIPRSATDVIRRLRQEAVAACWASATMAVGAAKTSRGR